MEQYENKHIIQVEGRTLVDSEEGYKYRCTDGNSDHERALSVFWKACKQCGLRKLPVYSDPYGEDRIAPRSLVAGTFEDFQKWLNKMNADLGEERFNDEVGLERPL
jgi:hypothetical protein